MLFLLFPRYPLLLLSTVIFKEQRNVWLLLSLTLKEYIWPNKSTLENFLSKPKFIFHRNIIMGLFDFCLLIIVAFSVQIHLISCLT